MKRLLLCGLIMSATACATAAQSPTLKADHRTELEQQLVKTERDWTEALKNRDKKALSQICSDDLLVTDEEGKVSTQKKSRRFSAAYQDRILHSQRPHRANLWRYRDCKRTMESRVHRGRNSCEWDLSVYRYLRAAGRTLVGCGFPRLPCPRRCALMQMRNPRSGL